MIQILTNTPAWVFGLFFVLVYFGIKQTRTRVVKRRMAYLLPAGMVVLSLTGISSSFTLEIQTLAVWLGGLSVASFLAYRFISPGDVSYDRNESCFHVPGAWLPLGVMMAIFFTKYTVAVMQGMQSPLVSLPGFVLALCFSYGCYSGYFVSRAFALVRIEKTH